MPQQPTQPTWQDLIAVTDLEKNWVTAAMLGKRSFAVYHTDDEIYVTHGKCSHAGAALCDGYFDGYLIECPLHQGCFDIRDGRAVAAPAVRPLKCYPCRIEQDMVQILL